jgi:predicted CXXCH cytochrome family protein
VLLAAFGLVGLASRAGAQETCVTTACHATLLQPKTVHAATESCSGCHESTAEPHPQAGQKTFKLTGEPPDLCFNCHDAFGKKKAAHAPVKDGQCTTCHDPHASAQAKLLTQPAGELCLSCHSDKTEFKHLHGPASTGDCTACHTPHESDVKPLLTQEVGPLCFGCHPDLDTAKKKIVHAALAQGCTSCHNPHGSAYPRLLAQEGRQVCYGCHDTIQEKVEKAAVAHPPVTSQKGCVSCHTPHAGDNASLLMQPEKETCLGCHKALITRAMTTLHGPIAAGRCTPCHEPHGSANAKLLVKEFSAQPYVPYTDKAFPLCFGCHKRELAQLPETASATGFRNGQRNLHYLHVNNAQKGRSCVLCHNVHGSAAPKLVADTVPFGGWNLPLRFVKTETGGTCSPGCHRPQGYDRQNPGKKLESPPSRKPR